MLTRYAFRTRFLEFHMFYDVWLLNIEHSFWHWLLVIKLRVACQSTPRYGGVVSRKLNGGIQTISGGAVGWGTALKLRRSRVRYPMVSLEFFIDIIQPAAMWPWGRLSLQHKWVPRTFPGGKDSRCVGLTTLPIVLEIWEFSTSWNLQGLSRPCNGIALPFYLLSTDSNTKIVSGHAVLPLDEI